MHVQDSNHQDAQSTQRHLADDMAEELLLGQLQTMGALRPDRPQTLDDLMDGVLPMYRRWYVETLALLARGGRALETHGRWCGTRAIEVQLARARWNEARAELRDDEGKTTYLNLVDATLDALPAILSGRQRATDVLFPQGSTSQVEGIYRNNAVSDEFNRILAAQLIRYMQARRAHDPSAAIRILEVGAGTGGTTGGLLATMHDAGIAPAEYVYTDVSKAFLAYGDANFAPGNPCLRTAMLDIEQPVSTEDFEPASYDAVVATNVLHATRDIRATLAHCKALLKRNGILLINEMIGGVPFLHLTFGLLEGWWRFEDEAVRIPGCPGVLPEIWARLLKEEGYDAVGFPANDRHHLGQQIIIARSDGRIRSSALARSAVQTKAVSSDVSSGRAGVDLKAEHRALDERLRTQCRDLLATLISGLLKMPRHMIDDDEPLQNYGLDSIVTTQFIAQVAERIPDIDEAAFFEHRNIAQLGDHLVHRHPEALASLFGIVMADAGRDDAAPVDTAFAASETKRSPVADAEPRHRSAAQSDDAIAIVGMSARFAGADDVRHFWRNLLDRRSTIGEVPGERWDWRAYPGNTPDTAGSSAPGYSRWGGFVHDIEMFDPRFFGILPRDAEATDPQELQFLQQCWSALEDAGYSPASLNETTRRHAGVFAAITKQYPDPETSYASLANRVSYHMDLHGKSLSIDTMCSSSLVALHEACEYLRHEGRLAIVGAVNLYLHPTAYAKLSIARCVASGADCKSFGEGGDGFVPGEGVGALVLKRLSDAEADGDTVYALVRGTGTRHTGRTTSYMASDPAQQAEAMRAAIASSDIDPRSIGYIEAAANGIEMGDAIEASALARVYERCDGIDGVRHIGSVKPNIGHCEAASGLSQIIKVALALSHGVLPATLSPQRRNPKIDWDRLPFVLVEHTTQWTPLRVDGTAVPRRAGITGIGGGGVTAHVILEEAPPRDEPIATASPEVFMLSAADGAQLRKYVEDWLRYLDDVSPLPAFGASLRTLRTGRIELSHRLAVLAEDWADLGGKLQAWLDGEARRDWCIHSNTVENRVVLSNAFLLNAWRGDPLDAAKLWVMGNSLPVPDRDSALASVRIAGLPTYPFARRPVWVSRALREVPTASAETMTLAVPVPDAPSATPTLPTIPPVPDKNVEAFYALSTLGASEEYREQYLTLCPFPERVPGFSMTRMFIEPEKYPEEFALMQLRQKELRGVLFANEDFPAIRSVFDIGCGMGTDVIQIAQCFPHIRTEGYTITAAQAALGSKRIERSGLTGRATIHCRDSAKTPFPGVYDLIIGIEVICHIVDKHGVLSNIARSLSEGGHVLLMDFIANGRGRISAPNIDIDIATREGWGMDLAEAGFVIESMIDVSAQIANFLYDPDFERNIAALPVVGQESFRNFVNSYISLEKGWTSYCLFRLRRASDTPVERRRALNAERLAAPVPYPAALDAMRRKGSSGYPPGLDHATIASPARGGDASESVEARIAGTLASMFSARLGMEAAEIRRASSLNALGLGSMHAVELTEAINRAYGTAFPSSMIFEHDSIQRLAAYIAANCVPADADASTTPARAVEAIAPAEHAANAVRVRIAQIVSEATGLSVAELDATEDLARAGINSITALACMEAVNVAYGLHLASSAIFETPSIDGLTRRVMTEISASRPVEQIEQTPTFIPAAAPLSMDYRAQLIDGDFSLRIDRVEVDDGACVELLIAGQGPVLVLIPGLGMAGSVFRGLAKRLVDHFTIVIYHYPGLAGSDPVAKPDIDTAVARLNAALSERGIAQPLLMGWSFGGLIAQRAVLSAPRRWQGLVLMNTFAAYDKTEALEVSESASIDTLYDEDLEMVFGVDNDTRGKSQASALLRASRALDPRHGVAYLGEMYRYDATRQLARLNLPVWVMSGTLNHFGDRTNGQRLSALIPFAVPLWIDGAGHAPFLSHEEEVATALIGILQKTAAHPKRGGAVRPDVSSKKANTF